MRSSLALLITLPVFGWAILACLLAAILGLGFLALWQAREIWRLRRGVWDVAAQLDADDGPPRTAGNPRELIAGRAAAAALRALAVLLCLAGLAGCRPDACLQTRKLGLAQRCACTGVCTELARRRQKGGHHA